MKDADPIIVKHHFQASVEMVWKAITEVSQMHQWYFDNIPDFRAEVGFQTKFLIQNEGRNFTHNWKVEEVIPFKRIAYRWHFDEYAGESHSSFELTEKGAETLLALKSSVLKPFPGDIPEFKRESGAAGWNYLIKNKLANHLK